MASRSGKPNRIHDGEFPLTGIMKCPACGAGMVIGRTTNKLKDGTKKGSRVLCMWSMEEQRYSSLSLKWCKNRLCR